MVDTDTELRLIVKDLAHERWGRYQDDADDAMQRCVVEARHDTREAV